MSLLPFLKTQINIEGLNLPGSLHLAESIISLDCMLCILDRCSNLTSCSVRVAAEIVVPSGAKITLPSLTSFYLAFGGPDEFFRYPPFKSLLFVFTPTAHGLPRVSYALHLVPSVDLTNCRYQGVQLNQIISSICCTSYLPSRHWT